MIQKMIPVNFKFLKEKFNKIKTLIMKNNEGYKYEIIAVDDLSKTEKLLIYNWLLNKNGDSVDEKRAIQIFNSNVKNYKNILNTLLNLNLKDEDFIIDVESCGKIIDTRSLYNFEKICKKCGEKLTYNLVLFQKENGYIDKSIFQLCPKCFKELKSEFNIKCTLEDLVNSYLNFIIKFRDYNFTELEILKKDILRDTDKEYKLLEVQKNNEIYIIYLNFCQLSLNFYKNKDYLGHIDFENDVLNLILKKDDLFNLLSFFKSIEFTDTELKLLYEAGIIIADTREELVNKVYENDDLDLYNDRLLEEIEGTKEYEEIKNQSFVDWFLSKRDCYFEYDNIYFTTPFNYMYRQEDFENIIKKVYEYKKNNNDNNDFFSIINKIAGAEIAY